MHFLTFSVALLGALGAQAFPTKDGHGTNGTATNGTISTYALGVRIDLPLDDRFMLLPKHLAN